MSELTHWLFCVNMNEEQEAKSYGLPLDYYKEVKKRAQARKERYEKEANERLEKRKEETKCTTN